MTEEHFFATTAAGWATDTDLFTCLIKLRKHTKDQLAPKKETEIYYFVCRVPLPEDSSYKIEYFVPKVKGCEVVQQTGYFIY